MKYAVVAALILPSIAGFAPLKAQEKSFEAASIKEALPLSMENTRAAQFHAGMSLDGSRAGFRFVSLADLIAYAYRVKPYQLSGPAWLNDARWDIVAKIPAGQAAGSAPDMMQTLLAERFGLSIHRQHRLQPVYELRMGNGGLKMKKAAPEGAADAESQPAGDGATVSGGPTGTVRVTPAPSGMQLRMTRITMPALAGMLMQFTDRPIVDSTKLGGDFEITLDLPGDLLTGMPAAQKLIALLGLGSVGMAPDTSEASILRAVKELGLELKPRRASVETIIVDHLEKLPTAN